MIFVILLAALGYLLLIMVAVALLVLAVGAGIVGALTYGLVWLGNWVFAGEKPVVKVPFHIRHLPEVPKWTKEQVQEFALVSGGFAAALTVIGFFLWAVNR